MEKRIFVSTAVMALGLATAAVASDGPTPPAGRAIEVRMVDVSATEYRFEPAQISVLPGDTVRFIQAGAMPHNVEFQQVPPGTNLGSAKMGPFLLKKGDTYNVAIDARFATGAHSFVCTPHQGFGMRGTITVAGGR